MAGRETPATRAARKAGVAFSVHEYRHDPAAEAYGPEAAAALGINPARVFKTLIVDRDGTLTVCILPVAAQLDLRALGKRAAMAAPERAERVTGYVAGGISPLGQRRPLPSLLDDSALDHQTVFISGGRRGLEIELAPTTLIDLTRADVRRLRRD
jgi:Cys-tRNA(Pro)/Cys-tRNA(Cys) deacylase